MTFILFILTFFKNLIYNILNDPIIRSIFFCTVLWLVQKYLKNVLEIPRTVSLLTYKIKNFIVPITAVMLYFFIFILLLTLYRIVNIYRVIDLKKLFVDLSTYIISSDKFALLLYILLVFLIVRVLLFFFYIIKTNIVKQFTMLYIYLFQYKQFSLITYQITRILGIPGRSLYYFLKNNFDITCTFCKKFIEHLGIIVLLSCLFYDIIFNSFIISKIYFIAPLVYIHMLAFSFKHFVERRDLLNDISLSNYYYKKHIREDTYGVYLENGDFYSKEDIQNLQEHILQNFKI